MSTNASLRPCLSASGLASRGERRPMAPRIASERCCTQPYTCSSRLPQKRSMRTAAAAISSDGMIPDSSVTGERHAVWSSHVSRRKKLESAIEDALENAMAAATVAASTATTSSSAHAHPDLALVFCSSAFSEEYENVVQLIRERVPGVKKVFGCSGYGVIGGAQISAEEVENAPAISITLAHLPKADVKLMHMSMGELPDADAPPERWHALLGLTPSSQPLSLVVLADPSFLRIQELLSGLDYALPAATKIGGLSSAGMMTPDRALFCWDASQVGDSASSKHGVFHTGAVIMALQGGVAMELLVAQGCRPLSSSTWAVEKVDRATNRILALREEGTSGTSHDIVPLEALQRDIRGLASTERELELMLQNLMLGFAPDNMKSSVEPQDFVIRNMGIDTKGYLAVGDYVRVGQRLRFMVRDQQGAMQDLESHAMAFKRRQLEQILARSGQGPQGQQLQPPLGMMIFSCNGRGTNLYNEPSYDTRAISGFIPVPASGFLCNGEIASIGSTTMLHGFTCAVGVLRLAPSQDSSCSSAPGAAASSSGTAAESEQGRENEQR